jgi:hypothetical protein
MSSSTMRTVVRGAVPDARVTRFQLDVKEPALF